MIDALLNAVLDNLQGDPFPYDQRTCAIFVDGRPRPNCGDVFASVHQLASKSTMDNALDEYFSFGITLTMRVANVPWDRIGDQLLARKLAQKIGFNARAEQIRSFFHMAWGVIQDANNYINDLNPNAGVLYGFTEPARYRGMEVPLLVGGEWFTAVPEAAEVGIKAEMRFEDARRLQAIAQFE